MSLMSLVRKPLVVAALGALSVAVPVSALYYSSAAHAAASTAAAVPAAPATSSTAAPVAAVTLPDFSSMVQKYGPAVVNITVTTKVSASWQGGDEGDNGDGDEGEGNGNGGDQNPFGPNSPFAPFFRGFGFQAPRPQPMHGEGSGFIIRSDGLILTNAHVVKGATEVRVRLTDRHEYSAKVVGFDSRSDIALVRINAKSLPTVRIGD